MSSATTSQAVRVEVTDCTGRLLLFRGHHAPHLGGADAGTHLTTRHYPRRIPENARDRHPWCGKLTSLGPLLRLRVVAEDFLAEALMFVGTTPDLGTIVTAEDVKTRRIGWRWRRCGHDGVRQVGNSLPAVESPP